MVNSNRVRIERHVYIDATPEECGVRLAAVMKDLGYMPVRGTRLTFKRGSLLGSLTSFSPRKWKARVAAEVVETVEKGTRVSLLWDVNTTGQQVTERETEYWNSEVGGVGAALDSGERIPSQLDQDHARFGRSGWKGVGVFVAVSLLVAVPIAFLGVLLFDRPLTGAATGTGLIVGFAFARKHWGL